jgi:hypothetical protein
MTRRILANKKIRFTTSTRSAKSVAVVQPAAEAVAILRPHLWSLTMIIDPAGLAGSAKLSTLDRLDRLARLAGLRSHKPILQRLRHGLAFRMDLKFFVDVL